MEYIHENEITTSTSSEMNKSEWYNDEWKRPDTNNTQSMVPFTWNSKLPYHVRWGNCYLCLGGRVMGCSGLGNIVFLGLAVGYIGLPNLRKFIKE